MPGFTLAQSSDMSFTCSSNCPYPCLTCINDVCTSCKNYYKLQGGKCLSDVSCNPQCQSCPLGTYYAQRDTLWYCVDCSINCATCYNESYCLACVDGYYISNTTCYTCPSMCKTCYDNFTCN